MRSTTDTSPSSIARVLRQAAEEAVNGWDNCEPEPVAEFAYECEALADALDQQAAAPTHYYVAECDNPSGGECLECGHRHVTKHYAQMCADTHNAADYLWVVGERMAPSDD